MTAASSLTPPFPTSNSTLSYVYDTTCTESVTQVASFTGTTNSMAVPALTNTTGLSSTCNETTFITVRTYTASGFFNTTITSGSVLETTEEPTIFVTETSFWTTAEVSGTAPGTNNSSLTDATTRSNSASTANTSLTLASLTSDVSASAMPTSNPLDSGSGILDHHHNHSELEPPQASGDSAGKHSSRAEGKSWLAVLAEAI
ncbi:hypothetical protein GQ53DRAFT_403871 [Thozetella sp. PMI_491]|nr:hypothetical protein GQ53DRAFT_403871 [Thozetella sp. PMI_491]